MIPLVNFSRWYSVHWAVIILSVLLTIAAWHDSTSQVEQKIQQRFDFLSSQLLKRINERMINYEDALSTGVVVIHTEDGKIDAESWKRFAEALKLGSMYRGINGIGVIFHVPPEKLEDFIKRERVLRPNFNIYPTHDKKEYWPITYVEPLKGNEQAIGLDMAFEQNRFMAAKKARDTAMTHITGPIILVQDSKKTPGFLQYVPFYNSQNVATKALRQKHFAGHVYAPFIMYKLIAGIFGPDERPVIFSIYDGKKRLYDELNSESLGYDPTPLYSKKVTLEMYNRSWDFTIQTSNTFNKSIENNKSNYILMAGITINCLIILSFIILAMRNKKSLILVDEMTKKVIAGEEYFRHIIEAAPCGMIITNDKGVIEKVNPQVEVLFGYREKELLGQSIDLLAPHRFHNVHLQHRESFQKSISQCQTELEDVLYGLKKNNDEFPVELGLAHFNVDGGVKILATVIDMTKDVAITNELKRSNKDLNEFAYVASHDLKAPLRGIMQLANWIEEDIADSVGEETKTHLKLLQSRTLRLEKLLDDLLTYSRVGYNHGEVKEIDVKEMIQNFFSLLDPPEGFSLNIVDPLPVFNTLVIPLEVIFRNLISNAIKHHDKANGTISISAIEYNKYFQFTVSNDGPGIDPKHHDRIFEMFKTLRPRDEVEGSGMGLSIIKRILDLQGEKIIVSSTGERDVSFIFTWPKNLSNKE
ncbi:MAG: PAS domain S-box-containing protein [Oleispira sp.]|jgi:PAS domain S-box-containing protein